MRKWLLLCIACLLAILGTAGYRVWAVNANPQPGSIWTYLGATLGADWVAPVGLPGVPGDGGSGDSTTPINNCLTQAGIGGTCTISGVVKILGTVTIPAGRTLDCGVESGVGLNDPVVPVLLTGPRILLDPGHSILFGGTSATLQNCVVVPAGMTFPQTSSSGWVGTAINTNGASAPQIINVAVTGFDTCINTTTNGGSLRPLLRRIWYDCNGVTNGGSLITGNNGDLAILENVAGQVLGTRADNCNRVRQGVGLLLTGSAWASRVIVQDYATTEVSVHDTGGVIFDSLWTDFPQFLGCPRGSSTGLVISNVNDLDIHHFDLNATQTGMIISNQGPNQVSHFGAIFLNGIGQDGIVIGASSGTLTQQSAGLVQIESLSTNQGSGNVGRFPVNYLDTSTSVTGDGLTGNSTLTVNGGLLLSSNGSVGPYIKMPTTTDRYRIRVLPTLITDLLPANSVIGVPTVACSGIGSGSCAIAGNLRPEPWSLVVNMTAGSGAAASGSMTITYPISTSFPSCVTSYQGGWGNPTVSSVLLLSARQVQVNWAQASALTNGNTYGIAVNCTVN